MFAKFEVCTIKLATDHKAKFGIRFFKKKPLPLKILLLQFFSAHPSNFTHTLSKKSKLARRIDLLKILNFLGVIKGENRKSGF